MTLSDQIAKRLRHLSKDATAYDELVALFRDYTSTLSTPATILDDMQHITFQTDKDGLLTFVSDAWESITGIPAAATTGTAFTDHVHPHDRAALQQRFQRLLYRDDTLCVETVRCLIAAEQTYYFIMHAYAHHDVTGTPVGVSGILYDASHHRTSRINFQQMFQRSHAIQLLIEPDTGRIVSANDAAIDFYGYSKEVLLSKRIQDLNILSEADTIAAIEDAHRQQRAYFEFEHQLASGEIRDVDVFSSPVDTPESELLHSIIVDVTGKREANVRYRALFEQSNDAVFLLNLDGDHLHVNQRAADMLGYSVEELLAMDYSDVVIRDEQDASINMRESLLSREKIPPYERQFRRKDGSLLFVEINLDLVRDIDGHPLHIQSIVRDITERKQSEAALIASREGLRRLIQQLPIGIQIFNPEGLCIDVNQAHLDIFGVERDDLVGRYNILTDELAKQMLTREAVLRALRGTTVHLGDLEFNFSQADPRFASTSQSTRTVNVTMVPILNEDNQVVQVVGVNVDITERQQMQETLRQSEKRYRTIIENLTDVCVLYDSDLRFIMVNQSASKIADLPKSYFVGKSDDEIFSKRITQTYMPLLSRAKETRLPQVGEIEINIRGKTYTSIAKYIPLLDNDGKLEHIIGMTTDITERRKMRQREFELAIEKERVNLLTNFIQNAAHEFRTPLSNIGTSTHLILRSTDSDYQQKRADIIHGQIDRITRLVDTLLLMAKLEGNNLSSFSTIKPSTILNGICQSLHDTYGDYPSLICDIPDDTPTIEGNATYLVTAIRHIITNAYQHTPDDGTISLTVRHHDHQILIEIADTGSGIPSEMLPRIFDTFWRRDEAHSTPGFGLGLSIARRIINLHSGQIDVESELDVGTHVRVTIPISTAD